MKIIKEPNKPIARYQNFITGDHITLYNSRNVYNIIIGQEEGIVQSTLECFNIISALEIFSNQVNKLIGLKHA